MATPPSGEQFEICQGDQRATIVEVGGGVREYLVGDSPVLDPYSLDAICDGEHGTPLIPWPNRLADGTYHFDHTKYVVPLSEPEKHNAIHGFLARRSWEPIRHETTRVVVGTRLRPLAGYPFALDLRVAYELGDGGLWVSTTATNIGDQTCPYGTGQHPYLSPGAGRIDNCILELGAATRILTDNERQLPTGTATVEGTDFDLRAGKRLGDQKLDTPFTDLDRDQDGRAWARLTSHRRPQHRTVGRPALSDHRDLHRRHPKSHTPTHGTRDRTDDLPAQRLPNRQQPDPP